MGIVSALLWSVLIIAVVAAILYWIGELDRRERSRHLRSPLRPAEPTQGVGSGTDVASAPAAPQSAGPAPDAAALGAAGEPAGTAPPDAPADDLKKIKGIGIVIEQKLHDMGITKFKQIAEFTAEDVERVNQVLNFSGRIERENWVDQARELMRGAA